MRKTWCLFWLIASVSACGDDGEEAPPPANAMIAGPYAQPLPITEDTRTHLPPGMESLTDVDEARFYWYAEEAAGKGLVFEVRAETTALEAGSVIHRVEEQTGEDQKQGMIGVGPRDLNRGGARLVDGSPRWLEGIYSVRIFVEDEELATSLFEVR